MWVVVLIWAVDLEITSIILLLRLKKTRAWRFVELF